MKYGIGAAAFAKMSRGQSLQGIVADTNHAGGGTTVTVNGTVGSKVYQNAVTTKDYTFTVSSGSNLALLVTLNFGSILVSSVSATWDQGGTNQAMTQIVTISQGAGIGTSAIFGLRAPTVVASGTLRVSWTTISEVFIAAICLAGVSQTSDGSAFPNTATATSGSTVNVTSAAGDLVVACESAGTGQGTATGTLIYDDHLSGAVINAMANYDTGSATVAIGNSGSNATIAATDIGHA